MALNVMPLGDSLTRGHGDPAWNGYRFDVQQWLLSVGLAPNMVGPWRDGTMGDNNHAGTSGARIDQVNAQVPQLMEDYPPDVVLLCAGTNDIAQQYDLVNAPARMRTLVERILQYRPPARVFVGGVPHWAEGSPKNADVDALNWGVADMVKQLGNPQVSYVPTHMVGQSPGELSPDGVHLSACGYRVMAFVWKYYLNLSDLNPHPGTWPVGAKPVCGGSA